MDLEGIERTLLPNSHPTDPAADAVLKRMVAQYNPRMVSRSFTKDGVQRETKWVWMELSNSYVERLVPLTYEEIQANKKPQGNTPFNPTSMDTEERLPLLALDTTRKRASNFSEENLGEENLGEEMI